jgi:hypothetical protein
MSVNKIPKPRQREPLDCTGLSCHAKRDTTISIPRARYFSCNVLQPNSVPHSPSSVASKLILKLATCSSAVRISDGTPIVLIILTILI